MTPAGIIQDSTRNILQPSYRTRCEHMWINHNFNGLVINNFISLIMTQTKSVSCRPTPGLHQRPPPAGLLQGSTRIILQTLLKDQVGTRVNRSQLQWSRHKQPCLFINDPDWECLLQASSRTPPGHHQEHPATLLQDQVWTHVNRSQLWWSRHKQLCLLNNDLD